MTKYKQFDGEAWVNFGKKLLKEKGSAKQKEFLKICKSWKEGFIDYIDEHYGGKIIGDEQIVFKDRLTEQEFIYPSKDTQKIIWNTFKGIHDEVAFSCGFWGYVVFNMIKDGNIEPSYLASEPHYTGIHMIDEALNCEEGRKKIDDCVRRILRSLCNPEPRGKRIVVNDFYLGKSYWRWRWSQKMSEFIDLEFDQVLEILNADAGYYGEFSGKMHSGKSYIGQKNVLGGLLLYLHESSGITSKKLGKIINRVSYLSAWKAIEMQEPIVNKKEIKSISDNLI